MGKLALELWKLRRKVSRKYSCILETLYFMMQGTSDRLSPLLCLAVIAFSGLEQIVTSVVPFLNADLALLQFKLHNCRQTFHVVPMWSAGAIGTRCLLCVRRSAGKHDRSSLQRASVVGQSLVYMRRIWFDQHYICIFSLCEVADGPYIYPRQAVTNGVIHARHGVIRSVPFCFKGQLHLQLMTWGNGRLLACIQVCYLPPYGRSW